MSSKTNQRRIAAKGLGRRHGSGEERELGERRPNRGTRRSSRDDVSYDESDGR